MSTTLSAVELRFKKQMEELGMDDDRKYEDNDLEEETEESSDVSDIRKRLEKRQTELIEKRVDLITLKKKSDELHLEYQKTIDTLKNLSKVLKEEEGFLSTDKNELKDRIRMLNNNPNGSQRTLKNSNESKGMCWNCDLDSIYLYNYWDKKVYVEKILSGVWSVYGQYLSAYKGQKWYNLYIDCCVDIFDKLETRIDIFRSYMNGEYQSDDENVIKLEKIVKGEFDRVSQEFAANGNPKESHPGFFNPTGVLECAKLGYTKFISENNNYCNMNPSDASSIPGLITSLLQEVNIREIHIETINDDIKDYKNSVKDQIQYIIDNEEEIRSLEKNIKDLEHEIVE